MSKKSWSGLVVNRIQFLEILISSKTGEEFPQKSYVFYYKAVNL